MGINQPTDDVLLKIFCSILCLGISSLHRTIVTQIFIKLIKSVWGGKVQIYSIKRNFYNNAV